VETDEQRDPAQPPAPTSTPPGRLRSGRAALDGHALRARTALGRWEAERPTVGAGAAAWRSDARIGGGLVAGGLAFRLFVFLLPVLLFAYTAFAAVRGGSPHDADGLADDVGLASFALGSVSSAADDATGGRTAVLVIALFGVLVTGANLVRSVQLTHRLAWGLPPARTRASPLGVAVATVAVLGLLVTNAGAAQLREWPILGRIAAEVLTFGVYAATWLGLSALLPHGAVRVRALLPGAVLVAAGGIALHVAAAWYLIGRADRAAEVYGPLGVATVLLLWLFIFGRLVVASALLNASLSRGSPHPDHVAQQGVPTTVRTPPTTDA
jgi:uncharacterized BrkB/YihY/UPF0761 family membrane protein